MGVMSEFIFLLFLSTFLLAASQQSLVREGFYFKQSPELNEPTQKQSGNEIQRIMEALKLTREAADQSKALEGLTMSREPSYDYATSFGSNVGVGGGIMGMGTGVVPSLFSQRLMMALRSLPSDGFAFGKDKRGKYMSLCHFKICNMGRKRWKSWA